MRDDEIIGLKSTAIKFKKNIKLFVCFCYILSFTSLTWLYIEKIGINLFTLLLLMCLMTLTYQLKIFKKKDPLSCLKAFKINNFFGLFLFLAIYLI